MNNRVVTLVNRATQQTHEFETQADADKFLGRFNGYLMQRIRRQEIVYSARTDDEYEVILGEDNRSFSGGNRQPCETCKNYAFGCEWSERFEPVPNWIAIPTVISNADHPVSSYHIIHCPKYVEG